MDIVNKQGETSRTWMEQTTLFLKLGASNDKMLWEVIDGVKSFSEKNRSHTFNFAKSEKKITELWSARTKWDYELLLTKAKLFLDPHRLSYPNKSIRDAHCGVSFTDACHNSSTVHIWQMRIYREREKERERRHFATFTIAIKTSTSSHHDTMNILTPRFPLHISERIITFLEFMRLMRQRQYKPENMYVTKRWLQKKYAIEALFFSPRILPKGQYTEIRKPMGYNFVPAFTNPQSSELGDFADNIYIKQGFQYCKIESVGMRLLMFVMILMDRQYQKKCSESESWWSD